VHSLFHSPPPLSQTLSTLIQQKKPKNELLKKENTTGKKESPQRNPLHKSKDYNDEELQTLKPPKAKTREYLANAKMATMTTSKP
jgi:hypothetical protein